MGDLLVYDVLTVQSHKGFYPAYFGKTISFKEITKDMLKKSHIIIDERVANLYQHKLNKILNAKSVLHIEATENNKSLEQFPNYIAHLTTHNIRRDHILIAIGGGIIQDITCFLSATLLRGINWWFYPTTLLAQTDSCIGSKSSINCSNIKNILGTFTPPNKIFIFTEFLKTLGVQEIQSGIGEMIKVHAIAGDETLCNIRRDYDHILSEESILLHYLQQSLSIKKNIIEQDEFDQGVRNLMNYGHTFGHAIESATNYTIPHGIAVTIGMDMANYVASQYDEGKQVFFEKMHSLLKKNYHEFVKHPIPFDNFINAIMKDKKNSDTNSVTAIIPDKNGKITKEKILNDELFGQHCKMYLTSGRVD